MRRLIRRVENAVLDVYEFWANTWYYLLKRHSPANAIDLARKTLPMRRAGRW